jgi:hypothetical protein
MVFAARLSGPMVFARLALTSGQMSGAFWRIVFRARGKVWGTRVSPQKFINTLIGYPPSGSETLSHPFRDLATCDGLRAACGMAALP